MWLSIWDDPKSPLELQEGLLQRGMLASSNPTGPSLAKECASFLAKAFLCMLRTDMPTCMLGPQYAHTSQTYLVS